MACNGRPIHGCDVVRPCSIAHTELNVKRNSATTADDGRDGAGLGLGAATRRRIIMPIQKFSSTFRSPGLILLNSHGCILLYTTARKIPLIYRWIDSIITLHLVRVTERLAQRKQLGTRQFRVWPHFSASPQTRAYPLARWPSSGRASSTVRFSHVLCSDTRNEYLLTGFWMSDKPLVQQALASELANLLLAIDSTGAALGFLQGFWTCMVREWSGIDRLRYVFHLSSEEGEELLKV